MKKKIAALCAVVALWTVPAGAVEMDTLYTGVRPLGMGNAFAAIADDENAAFYNPAGLSFVEEGRVEILNPKIDVSTNTLDFQRDASNLKSGDTVAAVDLMRKYIGKHQHLAVDVFPNYTRHNFEIGGLARVKLSAEVNSPSYPVLQADLKTDMGVVLAVAHGFMDDHLRAGVTLKYLQHKRFFKEFTAVDIASQNTSYNFNDNVKTSSKFGADLGLTYAFENEAWKPRVALVVQNLGDMNFGDYQATSTSPVVANTYKQQVNLGAAVTRDFWITKALLAVDYNDISGNVGTDKDKGKRLHMGVELKFPKILALRAGLKQGYMTFGAGLNFWLLKLDYAYYKEEVGAYAGQREDARHVIELSMGW